MRKKIAKIIGKIITIIIITAAVPLVLPIGTIMAYFKEVGNIIKK